MTPALCLLVARDSESEWTKICSGFTDLRIVRDNSQAIQVAKRHGGRRIVILKIQDLRGLPSDGLERLGSIPDCAVLLLATAPVVSAADYVRWFQVHPVADVLLPGMEAQVVHVLRRVIDGVREPHWGSLIPPPPPPRVGGMVYLASAYADPQRYLMTSWVKPSLEYAGYTGVMIDEVHAFSIEHAERSMASQCAFAVVHMGLDGRRGRSRFNERVIAEVRTLRNLSKLVVGIRPEGERATELPEEFRNINCHHFVSEPELARWLYKTLTTRRENAAAGAASD